MAATVDEYLAGLSERDRATLSPLRGRLLELVPGASEAISYGMPAVTSGGRPVVWYAAWKRHCTIYPISDALLERHAAAIAGYGRTKGGLHFTPERPLPSALLEDLVTSRLREIGATG